MWQKESNQQTYLLSKLHNIITFSFCIFLIFQNIFLPFIRKSLVLPCLSLFNHALFSRGLGSFGNQHTILLPIEPTYSFSYDCLHLCPNLVASRLYSSAGAHYSRGRTPGTALRVTKACPFLGEQGKGKSYRRSYTWNIIQLEAASWTGKKNQYEKILKDNNQHPNGRWATASLTAKRGISEIFYFIRNLFSHGFQRYARPQSHKLLSERS